MSDSELGVFPEGNEDFFFFNRSLWNSGDKHEQIWGLLFQPSTVSGTVLAQGRSMTLGTVEDDTSDKTHWGSLLTVANTMFQEPVSCNRILTRQVRAGEEENGVSN